MSCNLDYLYTLSLAGQTVSEKIFEYHGNIHVYSPGAWAEGRS